MSGDTAQRLVVVGASLSGMRAAQAARDAGFAGRITMWGDEPHLPYDRPPLSKSFLLAQEPPAPERLAPPELVSELGIALHTGVRATGVDVDARRVQGRRGDEEVDVAYDALVIATGARPRSLPGCSGVEGVTALRTVEDAQRIREALHRRSRVAVVGAGFVGLEVASAATSLGAPVTVVEAAPRPLARSVDARAGGLLRDIAERHGVEVRCGTAVEEVVHERGRVSALRLGGGDGLPADLVVAGIGTTPNTDWLAGAGLDIDDGVVCDAALAASAPGVWAAGDVARIRTTDGIAHRSEHWTAAAEEGALAGRNAVAALSGGSPSSHLGVPYFWSDLFGHKVQSVGSATDDSVLVGSPEGPWIVLYRDGRTLAGALTLDLPGRIMKFRRLLAGQQPATFDAAHDLASNTPLPAPAAV